MNKLSSLTIDEGQEQDTQASRTHYRSKLYTSKTGVNPLVSAANPIFSILERINLSEKLPELIHLQENLSHELQAFMTNASTSEHMKEILLVARYMLCATIDEVIDKAYHKNKEDNSETIRIIELNPSSEVTAISSDIHFFQILDNAMTKPDFYLDVIELTYFCIITGFEGKYRTDPNGKQSLENLLDRLYQVIQEHKPPTAEKLFILTASSRRFASIKSFPWKWFASIITSVLVVSYLLISYQLNQHASHLLQSSFLTNKNASRTY